MSRILASIVLASTCGCLSVAPVVPVTPQNQAQVSTCQGIASLHNGVVVGDFMIGGVTSGLAGVAAGVTDTRTKNDLAIGASIAGAIGMVGTAVAGLTAADFAGSNCTTVVAPLPAAKKKEEANP